MEMSMRRIRLAWLFRALACIALIYVSGNLLILYLRASFAYSSLVGREALVGEKEFFGGIANFLLGSALSLQFIIAFLLWPARNRRNQPRVREIHDELPESKHLSLWERYWFWIPISVVLTLAYGWFLFVTVRSSGQYSSFQIWIWELLI